MSRGTAAFNFATDAPQALTYTPRCRQSLTIFERKGPKTVVAMNFILFWLAQLTDSFALLFLRQRGIEARLKQVEEEVKTLREQRLQ